MLILCIVWRNSSQDACRIGRRGLARPGAIYEGKEPCGRTHRGSVLGPGQGSDGEELGLAGPEQPPDLCRREEEGWLASETRPSGQTASQRLIRVRRSAPYAAPVPEHRQTARRDRGEGHGARGPINRKPV